MPFPFYIAPRCFFLSFISLAAGKQISPRSKLVHDEHWFTVVFSAANHAMRWERSAGNPSVLSLGVHFFTSLAVGGKKDKIK